MTHPMPVESRDDLVKRLEATASFIRDTGWPRTFRKQMEEVMSVSLDAAKRIAELEAATDMLLLCGECGGQQDGETPAQYLRRLIDALIIAERELDTANANHRDMAARLKDMGTQLEQARSALAEERDKHQWRTIDSAPKDREIMVAGGTYYSTANDWLTEYPCETWHLAYWDGDGWRGEPDEQYDTFKFYKPTHWMEKIALPDATAIRSGKPDGKE